jgi:hypothetical protein
MCHNFMADRPWKKRPNEPNLLAMQIVEEAIGEPLQEKPRKKPAKEFPSQ